MPLAYDGANGLFTRLGTIFDLWNKTRTFQGDWDTEVQDIQAEFTDADMFMIQDLVARIQFTQHGIADLCLTQLRAAAEKVAIEMIDAAEVLERRDMRDALIKLREIMVRDSETLDGTNIGATVTPDGDNVGTGELFFDVRNPLETGTIDELAWIWAETLSAECVEDVSSGRSAGQEVFRIRGQAALDRFDVDFPGGSGIDIRLPAASADLPPRDQPNYSILRNGNFERWSGGAPLNWEITEGGSIISQETGSPIRGSSSLKVTGDGSTDIFVRQQLGASGDNATPIRLKPGVKYFLGVSVKHGGNQPTTGQLVIRLALFGTGVAIDLTAITADPDIYGAFVQVDEANVDQDTAYYFEIDTQAAISNGDEVIIDDVLCVPAVQLQPAGPYATIPAGPAPFVIGDNFSIAVTNAHATDGAVLHKLDEVLRAKDYGNQAFPPTDDTDTETIDDAVIA
jgi:hypothetical protein